MHTDKKSVAGPWESVCILGFPISGCSASAVSEDHTCRQDLSRVGQLVRAAHGVDGGDEAVSAGLEGEGLGAIGQMHQQTGVAVDPARLELVDRWLALDSFSAFSAVSSN